MGKTFKSIISRAEKLGWCVTDSRKAGFLDEGVTELEFSKYSPAGEDFSFAVEGDSPDSIIEEIRSYSADFDTEEHIEMWVKARHNGRGVPSIKELVEDADAIENMLRELAETVTYGILAH